MSEIRSSEAVARIRNLVEQISQLKTELAAAERTRALAVQNRQVVEAVSGDSDLVIAKAKASVDAVRGKLSGARSELDRLFVAESTRREKARADVFARVYTEFVVPRAKRFAALTEAFELAVAEIVALLDSESEIMRRLEDADAAIREWNRAVVELSGPGNSKLDEKSLAKTLRESLIQNVGLRDRFEPALSQLKDALNPPPPKPKPLTEEALAELRFEQKLNTAARQKQLDSEDARTRSAIS